MANLQELMRELNPAQLRAVQHPPQIPLQILAGPGSGKTKVLTMRIAYLIAHCYLPPWSLCAVTFTNKAANEMRERLVKLIGKDNTAQIKMGTFHALCAKFLRKYSRVVGIEGNFTVCDADESKKIIARLLKPYKDILASKNITLTENSVVSIISKVKAKGWTADDARRHVEERNAETPQQRLDRLMSGKNDFWEGEIGFILADIYKDYEKDLRTSNSLDFDDLLVFGVKLFGQHAKASSWCRHVLVDEYQDTNIMQYDLMVHIARGSRCVTIVGDPDQSIYGWRSAEVENLAKMQREFPATQQIYLEHNYRSTGSILALSLAIVSQDPNRIQKTLRTSHSQGPIPVLRMFPVEQVEAAFIAAEIKRLVAYSGNVFNWGDFVVLLRYNAHSRLIESALQKEGIPNRVLAGQKFFERMEIKDVLAYLQLVDNPHFAPAFMRVVNVPARALGAKSVNEINLRAEQLKISPLQVAERIVDGDIPDIKPPAKKKLAPFIDTLRILRKHANDGIAPSKLINALVDTINYEDHLRKTQPDCESRWENVQELVNFASEVERSIPDDLGRRMQRADAKLQEDEEESEEEWADELEQFDADQLGDGQTRVATGDTPLRLFLQASMLSTDTQTPEEEKSEMKVTISTCHAAKGLEWPVVMIPAVESGVFPSARSEDTAEERRLLYVACTRAQGLLYLTHTASRMWSGEYKPQCISPFVSEIRTEPKTKDLVTEDLPPLHLEDRQTIAKVINRPLPDEIKVVRATAEYEKSARHPAWGENAPFREPMGDHEPGAWQPQQFPSAPFGQGGQRLGGAIEHKQDGVQPVPGPVGFSSGSALLSASQRVGANRPAASFASNSRVVNTTPRTQNSTPRAQNIVPRTQQGQSVAGPSNANNGAKKPLSTSAINARGRLVTRARGNTVGPSQRRSSTGTSKDDPIDIDDDPIPVLPRPTAVKPAPTRPPSSGHVVSPLKANAPSRPLAGPFTSHAHHPSSQRVSQPPQSLTPAPPSSLAYHSPPSSVPSLSSSASGSRPSVMPSSPLEATQGASLARPAQAAPSTGAAPQLAGTKRRLGMGRTVVGYANKKFKPPVPGGP